MSAWIVSIVGVICLGVLLEILLPDGQTAKYIRGAFSLLVIFVIISPLPALLGREWNFDVGALGVNESYVSGVQSGYLALAEGSVEKYLAEEGYEAKVSVTAEDAKLKVVEIEISNFNPLASDEVEKDVKRLVSQKFDCDTNKICVFVV